MSGTHTPAHTRANTLRTLFNTQKRTIGTALGAAGIGLEDHLTLDDRLLTLAADDLNRRALRLHGSKEEGLYGEDVGLLFAIAFSIMNHLPVTSPSLVTADDYPRRLANAVYAVLVAFSYLEIDAAGSAAITRRLVVFLIGGGVPKRLEANLAALRWFHDAHIRRPWFGSQGRLREGCAFG